MTDNFDFKKFLAENRLGAYSRAGKLNEAVDPRELGAQMTHPDDIEPAEPNLKGKVTQVTPDGTITIELDGPTAKTVVVDSDDFVTKIDGAYYKALYDNHEEGQDIELEPVDYSDSSRYLGPGEDENFGLDDKTDHEERVYEALSREAIDRIDAIVSERNLERNIALAFEYFDGVAQELEGEVDEQDIADYIHMRVSDYYGKPSLR